MQLFLHFYDVVDAVCESTVFIVALEASHFLVDWHSKHFLTPMPGIHISDGHLKICVGNYQDYGFSNDCMTLDMDLKRLTVQNWSCHSLLKLCERRPNGPGWPGQWFSLRVRYRKSLIGHQELVPHLAVAIFTFPGTTVLSPFDLDGKKTTRINLSTVLALVRNQWNQWMILWWRIRQTMPTQFDNLRTKEH